MKNSLYLFLCILGCGILLVSCKDDDDNTPTPVDATLEVQMRVGSETFTQGSTYDINGTKMKIDVAQFYIGNIELDGDEDYEIEDYFIGGKSGNFALGSVLPGEYDFEFGVGVEAEINNQSNDDFTTRPAGDPLGMVEPSMNWNWNSGYKFLRIDGVVDADGDDIPETAVQYHLGSDAYYALLTAPNKINLDADNTKITMRFDIAGLFTGVDLSGGESTHVGDNKDLADSLLANYPAAFSILF